MKFIKNVLTIIIAAVASFFAHKQFKFDTFGNVIMFMGIYIVTALIFEFIFKKITKNKATKPTKTKLKKKQKN